MTIGSSRMHLLSDDQAEGAHPSVAARLLVNCSGIGLSAVFGVLSFVEGAPPAVVVLFVALVIIAENRDRLFGDETSISASIAVAVASAVVFRETAPLLAPLIVGSCAAFYWPHIRDGQFAKMTLNATSIGLSALMSALVLHAVPSLEVVGVEVALLWVFPVVLLYWLVNSCLLAAASIVLRGGSFWVTAKTLLRSETGVLAFAWLGGLCGYLYVTEGRPLGIWSLVLLLLVFDSFITSGAPARAEAWWGVSPTAFEQLPRVFGALVCWILAADSVVTASCVGLMLVLVAAGALALLRFRRTAGTWEWSLAIGIAIAELPWAVAAVATGIIAESFGFAAAFGFTSGVILCARAVSWVRHRRDARAPSDQALLEAVELALLDRREPPSTRAESPYSPTT